jgi:glycosyltransferase involved in cell wall biosynthesis
VTAPVDRQGRIALVPARFGQGAVGGAEIVLEQMARRLQARGWEVEILTTCALDHHTWENVLPAGKAMEDGLLVHRFPVVTTPGPERAQLEQAILSGAPLRLHEQQRWMNAGMRSPELFHYLLDHSDRYRALVFAPYLFWPAYACGQVDPYRSILMPCLHDEPAAYLELFQPLFTGCRGLWFLSDPEARLAERIHPMLPPHETVGSGIEVPDVYDPEGFRRRHGIEGRFVLYAGRREGAKNWEWLLDAFAAAIEEKLSSRALNVREAAEKALKAGPAD